VCVLRCYKQYPRRAIISSYPRGYLYTYVIYHVILHYCGYGVCGRRRRRRRLAHSIHGRRCEICSIVIIITRVPYSNACAYTRAKMGSRRHIAVIILLYSDAFSPVVAAAVRDKFIARRHLYR